MEPWHNVLHLGSTNPIALTFPVALTSYIWSKRYEPTGLLSQVLLLVLLPGFHAAFVKIWLNCSYSLVPVVYISYYATLTALVAAYRLSSIHPLHTYPGPLPCRISKLWLVYISSQGKQHLYFKALHDRYGPIVRVGPNELSIINVDDIPSILGINGMPKGPLWEGRRIKRKVGQNNEDGNLIGIRDLSRHAELRKVWNRAFTTAAVKRYEPLVARRTTELVDELLKRCQPNVQEQMITQVDMSQWMSLFSFDFMGDFTFNSGSDFMKHGDKDGVISAMDKGLYLPALIQHVPWAIDALSYMPFLGRYMKGIGTFALKQAMRRMHDGSIQDDLWYHLNDEAKVDATPPKMHIVMWNAITAIVAGSDTAASTLSNAIYCLVCNPTCLDRLRTEVDMTFASGRDRPLDAATLAQMKYLGAVIYETLRLFPPVNTSLQRSPAKGSGGHMLASGLFIPEGVSVYVPPYVYHRDSRYFHPSPGSFRPDRWLDEKGVDEVCNQSAFIPFSAGPASCVGRPLAMIEMRMVLASLVHAFDIQFAEDYDSRLWTEELQDFFTTSRGSLPVVLTARSTST